jgi:hypothetical protein
MPESVGDDLRGNRVRVGHYCNQNATKRCAT